MAACSSLMNRARFVGRGMATVLSEASPLPPPPTPAAPPSSAPPFASATEGCCAPTTNAAAARAARAKIAGELIDLLLRLRVETQAGVLERIFHLIREEIQIEAACSIGHFINTD